MKSKKVSKGLDGKAVMLFLLLMAAAIFFLNALSKPNAITEKAMAESPEMLISKLTVDLAKGNSHGFIVKDTVDPELFNEFAKTDYEQLKKELGLNSDFVIHFEDQEGRVLVIGQKLCLGSSIAEVNGVPCG